MSVFLNFMIRAKQQIQSCVKVNHTFCNCIIAESAGGWKVYFRYRLGIL